MGGVGGGTCWWGAGHAADPDHSPVVVVHGLVRPLRAVGGGRDPARDTRQPAGGAADLVAAGRWNGAADPGPEPRAGPGQPDRRHHHRQRPGLAVMGVPDEAGRHRQHPDGSVGRLISIAYPAADVLLLALVARLLVGAGVRNTAFQLLAGSLVVMLAGDVGFAVLARPMRSLPTTPSTSPGCWPMCCSGRRRCTRRWRSCPSRPWSGRGGSHAGGSRC
jgi:hypothetical protein